MLALDRVTKKYGAQTALDGISLTFEEGKTTVLLGPSGCGKSTLLRILLGLVPPDAGRVLVRGTEIGPVGEQKLSELRREFGYVIQDGGLFPHLTARANLTLMPQFLGWSGERTDARVAELATLTGFPDDALDRYPAQLSGGQRQRVALMRALVLNPDILLMDEPLGALDPIIRRDLQEELRRIFSRLGKTTVIVTHDLAEAGFLADRIVLLKEGKIVQQGSLADLLVRPADAFVRQFVNAQRYPLDVERERPTL